MQGSRENTFITWLFLYLARSTKYKDFKNFFRKLFKDTNNKYKQYIDYFLIFLIISSVSIFIYEVKHPINKWLEYYAVYFTSTVFLIEYLINFWLYNNIHEEVLKEYNQAKVIKIQPQYFKVLSKAFLYKLSYILTPVAIIDLLAILPAYRPLRVLRILVLFRFLKLLKHSKNLNQFIDVINDRRFELLTLFGVFLFVVFVGGLAIYILEETQNKNINSFFDAIYWSFITVTTVGYGDISPVTPAGRVVSFIIILLGITMVSFATSVIVSAFSEKLDEIKEDRVTKDLNKNSEFLIICGYGQLTKMFLKNSLDLIANNRYVILDKSEEATEQAKQDGYQAICDDASRFDVLKKFINQKSKITLLALTGSDIENIYITLNAKSIKRKVRVIAAARDAKLYKKYIRAGADRVTLPNEIASSVLSSAITNPTVHKAFNAILSSKNISNIEELYINKNSKIVGKNIYNCSFKQHNLIIFAIKKGFKGEFIFNPKQDYVLEENDIIIVLGHKVAINYFRNIYKLGSY